MCAWVSPVVMCRDTPRPLGEVNPRVGVFRNIPSPLLTTDRADECGSDPGLNLRDESRRSLEDSSYLGMLLTTSADISGINGAVQKIKSQTGQ